MRARVALGGGLGRRCLVGGAVALGLSGCSSDTARPSASTVAPMPGAGSSNPMPAPDGSVDPNAPGSGTSATTGSETQPVTDFISTPPGQTDPGGSSPGASGEGMVAVDPAPAPRPPAELPSTEPTVSGPVDVDVTVNVEQRFQTLVGFGASQVYYVDWLTLHPNKDELYDVIFGDLGLDVLRIGNWYQARDMQDPQILNTIELVQRAEQSLGRFPEISMTSWSPPADLKSNGEVANGGTLVQRDGAYAYDEFADWWLESVSAYRAAGVPVSYVGIQNEPDFTAAYDSARFSAGEGQFAGYGEALAAVRQRVATLDAPPALIGPEVIGLNVANITSYLDNLDRNDLDVVAHHLYSGGDPNVPDSFNGGMAQMAAVAAGKV